MRRFALPILLSALAMSACGGATGPEHPIPYSSLSPADWIDQAGARGAAIAFLQAYAGAPQDGGEALQSFPGSPAVLRWAHWFGVQNQEFPGTATGKVSIEDIGPAVTVEDPGGPPLRTIEVRATATFTYTPDGGKPIQVVRSLNGPISMVRARDGRWLVVDFTRDGSPISSSILGFHHLIATVHGVQMRVDSLIADRDSVQLGLIVRNGTDVSVSPAAAGATLLTSDGSKLAGSSGAKVFLGSIAPGETGEGLVTVPPQAAVAGVTLRVALSGGGRPLVFDFSMGDIAAAAQPLPPAGLTSPSPAPGTSAGAAP